MQSIRRGSSLASVLALVWAMACAAAPRSRPRPPPKPTAPIALRVSCISGGGPGELARIRVEAHPLVPGARLDLELALPATVELVGGSTAGSDPGEGGLRRLEAEVQLPPDGVHLIVAKAHLSVPGQSWHRAAVLVLPAGQQKADPAQPLVPYGEGSIIELGGEGGP